MKFIDVKKSSFEEALAATGKKKGWGELQIFKNADKEFGTWISAKIPIRYLPEIIMPYHLAYWCSGKFKLRWYTVVPKKGMTLSEAHERFLQNKQKHKELAPECYENILFQKKRLKNRKIEPVLLSIEPLNNGISHKYITEYSGITLLDGFHRLLAMMDMRRKPPHLSAFIAIKNIKDIKKYII